jgi:serine/threonine protein kinase
VETPLPGYKVLKTFSKTSANFARVLLLQEVASGEKFVYKSLVKGKVKETAFERLRRESTFTFNIPGLPFIKSVLETENEMAFLKKFEEGLTLKEFWLAQSRKGRKRLFKAIIVQLVQLLAELEKEGIFHLDLKPENILIQKEKEELKVSLIDFGMARRKGEVFRGKTFFQLSYSAPELILNLSEVIDQRSDFYSLGLVVYFMLSKELPFTHPNPGIASNLALTYPLERPGFIKSDWWEWLGKLCAKHQFRKSANFYSREELLTFMESALARRPKSTQEIKEQLQQLSASPYFTIKDLFGFQVRR